VRVKEGLEEIGQAKGQEGEQEKMQGGRREEDREEETDGDEEEKTLYVTGFG
jgi:hypothetical protein